MSKELLLSADSYDHTRNFGGKDMNLRGILYRASAP